MPEEFLAWFEWMETSDFVMPSGAYVEDNLGLLGTTDDVQSECVTAILFRIATPAQAREFGEGWFGDVVPDIEHRLVPFARTGGDGSCAAFRLDDEGYRQIVHLGSEGLVRLLGRTPLNFLRLLAIGYQEISDDCLGFPDEPPAEACGNSAYRAWLADRYGVTIPERAREILGDFPNEEVEISEDPFWQWARKTQDERDRA